ncbi:MAG TPA: hypothetical protein VFG59_12875 [Anaeromyxobacter sp.]|nr:hypothetical protein [Anaeromyxobacter sp.]
MLAYVFWHWPRPGLEPDRYADALLAFHRALAATAPEGYRGSRVLLVSPTPWLPVPRAYEDWYLLDGFGALGALNEAAVAGARKEPHDGAARLVQGGAGGLYRQLREGDMESPEPVTWFDKPAGVPYPDFLEEVPPAELWQRQLVLGPAPEFRLAGALVPAAAAAPRAVEVRRLY